MIYCTNIAKTFVRNIGHKGDKKPKLFQRTKEEFFAVKDVSLSVKKGEILGILGPNGAGKTTLLRILGHIMSPTRGEVVITDRDGREVKDEQEAKRRVGYLSANTKLYGRMTPKELLVFIGRVYGFDKKMIDQRMQEVIELLDMSSFCDNKIEKLSTGQLQRTSISRCLLHDPDNYIFDEPTLGLDVISSHTIVEFMKKEKQRGKSILYSTHYMEEAEYLCDRVLMVHKGRVLIEGSPAQVREKTSCSNLRDVFISMVDLRKEEVQ